MLTNLVKTPLQWNVAFVLVDLSIKAALIVVLAAAVSLALRRLNISSSQRHLVWCAALGLILVLPAFMVGSPGHAARTPHYIQVAVLPVLAQSDIHMTREFDATAGAPSALSGSPIVPAERPGGPAVGGRFVLTPYPWETAYISQHAGLGVSVFVLWISGALLSLLPVAIGFARLRRVFRSAAPFTNEAAAAMAAGFPMQPKRTVRVIVAAPGSGIEVPVTWGFVRPVIGLPSQVSQWPQARLQAALVHEYGHILRGDCFTQMMGRVACALHWFNPAVWYAARQMRREAERAADDYALTSGLAPAEFAGHLVDIARTAARSLRTPRQSVAMVGESKLESRIKEIVDWTLRRGQASATMRVAATAVSLVLLAAVTTFRFTAAYGEIPWWISQHLPSATYTVVASPGASSVTLPNGVTVRLVGLAGLPDTRRAYWSIDGASLSAGDPLNRAFMTDSARPPGYLKPPTPGETESAFCATATYNSAEQEQVEWEHDVVGGESRMYSFGFIRQPYWATHMTASTWPTGNHRPGEKPETLSDYCVTMPDFSYYAQPDDLRTQTGLLHTEIDEGGRHVTDGMLAYWSYGSSARTATLRFGAAGGPWTETVSCKYKPGRTTVRTPSGNVVFTIDTNPRDLPNRKAAEHGNAFVTVTDHFHVMDAAGRQGEGDYQRQLLGYDSAGKVAYEFPLNSDAEGDTDAPFTTGVAQLSESDIPNAVLRRVATIRLALRPYYWAEFRNVALEPKP